MCCKQDGLTRARRGDNHAALAEAERRDQIDDPHVDLVRSRLELDAPLRMQGRQVVEANLFAELVGIFKIDRLDPQKREIALVFLGGPDLARDDRAGFQAETANLAGRDVDIVGAGEVVVIGAPQEAEAVGKDLERPFAVHQAVLLDPFFEDLEDQVLLLEAHVVDDPLGLRRANQLGHRHFLELGEMNLTALDVFVTVVQRGVAEDVFFAFGQFGRRSPDKRGRRRRDRGGPLRARGGHVLGPVAGGQVGHFAIGPLAIGRHRRCRRALAAVIVLTRSLAQQRRQVTLSFTITVTATVAVAVASHRDAVVMNGRRPSRSARSRARRSRTDRPGSRSTIGSRTGSRSRWRMNRIGSRSAGPSSRYGSRSCRSRDGLSPPPGDWSPALE